MISGASAPEGNRTAALLSALAGFAVLVLQLVASAQRSQLFGDFHAFYCGGKAMLAHADPYAGLTLGACEAQQYGHGLYAAAHGLVAPVPFPGYAFVLFCAFALLPYLVSALLWLALTAACTAYCAFALSRLTAQPLWLTTTVVAGGYAIAVLGLGEVAPIALAALCASALELRAQRYWAASILLCVAAILPHVLLPAFAAVFLFVPRARLPLIVCGLALAIVDVLIGGPAQALSYFTRVLPAHAQSEIGYIAQYGITWIAHGAGLPDRSASLAGDMCYAGGCIAALIAARMLVRRSGDAAYAVLLPPAFAVTFAPFMHYSEITLALPFALMLASASRARPQAAPAVCLVLLASPWQWIVGEAQIALPVAVLVTAALSLGVFRSGRAAIVACACAVGYAAVLLVVAAHTGPQVQALSDGAISRDLAQAAWSHYIRSQGASAGAVWWVAKLPTWFGAFALCACGSAAAVNEDLVPSRIVDRMPVRP
jgi:hypothetical protein